VPDGDPTPTISYELSVTRNGDIFHVENLPYVNPNTYRSMMAYLNSVPYNTGQFYRLYWEDASIRTAEVPLTSGFTSSSPKNSGAPVSISVGELQPIGGE
jgi:hypothetical protein